MLWQDAIRVAFPSPAFRYDQTTGNLWVCYLNGAIEVFNPKYRRIALYKSELRAGDSHTDWRITI